MGKKSLKDKLKNSYSVHQKMGDYGYVIGFYNELNENLLEKYEFQKGKYTIWHRNKNEKKEFIHFYYTPNN